MRWTPGGVSEDIEDRRGDDGGGGGFGFGGLGAPHLGIGGTILLLILSFVFRTNLFSLFSGGGSAPQSQVGSSEPVTQSPAEGREVQFVSSVLDDMQKSWEQLLPNQAGVPYRHAKLVLFRNYTRSACGAAQTATGPFYCPGDEKVYIDLGFYDELKERFGAPGEFAQAYVLAHELGHHVQKILGTEQQVRRMQRSDPDAQNQLSVRLELQADCYAGIWGHSSAQRQNVDQNDIRDGLRAAAAVGDDRLQRMSQGYVSPDSFTHGSSAQRQAAFQRGFEAGTLQACEGSR